MIPDINYWAVVLATISTMIVVGLGLLIVASERLRES